MIRRSKVLWFGAPPSAEAKLEAEHRHLSIEEVRATPPSYATACAAVFWATPPHLPAAMEALETHLVHALDEGLYVQVVVADDAGHDDALGVVRTLVEEDCPVNMACRIGIGFKPHEVLEKAARHLSGPAINHSLNIAVQVGVVLSPGHEFMLRRAFSDCKSISLQRIAGGKSGAQTFYVDATLATSTAGPKPMPYFAKLDHPKKLAAELSLYSLFAEHHIPWHLRPNFQSSRCLYGVRDGILVGSFVENSQSLWEQARAGHGRAYIRALFDETLLGWRQQAQLAPLQQAGSVVAELRHFCDIGRIPPARVRAANALGHVDQPTVLWRKLINLPHERWRRAPMHGDMHAENVRVRKTDAIVIDFAKATHGPMCADLASLEVWLAFQAPPPGESRPERKAWLDSVKAMYSIDATRFSMSATTESGWIEECVTEIRSNAKKVCYGDDEYDRVLALYLLRHASFPADPECFEEDEYRRTTAYWLANRMVNDLTTKYLTPTSVTV